MYGNKWHNFLAAAKSLIGMFSMTSMKFPIYNFYFISILILTLILLTRLGKCELLDRAIYFNLNIKKKEFGRGVQDKRI